MFRFGGSENIMSSVSSEEDVEDEEEIKECVEEDHLSVNEWPLPGTLESGSKRTKQREADRKRTTIEQICSVLHSSMVDQQQKNSTRKKNSPENPSKGKGLVHPSTRGPTSKYMNSEDGKVMRKSFIQVVIPYLFGLKTTIHPLLENFWEAHLNQLLSLNPIPTFDAEIIVVMRRLIKTLAKSPSELAVITYLSGQKDSLLQMPICAETQKALQDFFDAFRIVLRNDNLDIKQNNRSVQSCPTTQSLSSTTRTFSSSVPATGESHWNHPGVSLSHTVEITQSGGWTTKTNKPSFITWVDPLFKYTVDSQENTGDWLVKTEIFSKSQVSSIPQWWKHPLHRSKVMLTSSSQAAKLMKRYTNAVENMFVDKATGRRKTQGVTNKRTPRVLPGPTFDQYV